MTTTSAVSTAIGKTVVEFLRRKVDEHGDRDALLFKPGFRYLRWSYRRIWRESGQVATLLQRRGIGKGDRVVLWGPNCPQWVLAFFGCLRAGVVVVPLDLRSAPDYVERVLSRTDPKLAFTSRFTPKEGVALDAPELTFEDLETVIHDLPDPEPVEVGADDLAEVMFTSGTTGDPKGVMLTHRNLTANIEGITEYVNVDPSSRLLSILPLSHMYEQMGGLFVVIYFGANVTYPTSRQPTVLARTMRERRTTVMLLVPQALDLLMSGIEREVRRKGKEGLWKMLLSVAERTPFRLRRRLFGTVHKQFGGKLDFIVSGGAALDPDLGRKWELLGVKIVQGYGATEASPVISNHTTEVHPLDSVGRPLPNVEVRIDDAGEILVRGESVTPGYWEAPEVTADSFEGDWYKTGDLGFFDDQGFLHIQGRVKDMIVLPSGQNVYPDDVQAVLNRHPAVVDSTVVGLPDGPAEEVHAALILDDSAEEPASGDEVVSWANERLAEQQRVRGFTIWPEEDFPRTHTLKVKKPLVIERLMESPGQQPPPAAAPSSNGASQPGVRGLEHIVAEVAQRSPAEVRPEMALGEDLDIDSLGRVELLSAVEAELGVYLDESGVTPETTVADLAGLIERAAASPPVTKFPKWGMRWWCRMARGAIQRVFVFPVLRLIYSLTVTDAHRLRGVTGPVIFASNHSLGLDNPLIIKAVPQEWRRRLAIAAAAHLWRNPIRWVANPLIGNGFPLARDGAVRPSLENMGKIVDDGWSILIFPEGQLTWFGPIKPFMNGTGLVAVEGRLPVVPMRLHIHRPGRPWWFPLLRRGSVEIRFGDPIHFPPGADYTDATQAIENAVRAL